MPRPLVALAAASALIATGCSAGRPWPAHPVAVATPAFATHGDTTTIDVLPLDLQMWAEPGYAVNLDDLRGASEVSIMNTVLDVLTKRSYAVGATIDWNGNFLGGNALAPDDLLATMSSLARYGATAASHPGQLPVPFLPARLGGITGADATLYVGGWSYVAEHRESTGEKVAEGIAIGLVVVGVVVLIAALLDSKGSGHGGHGGHGGGHGGSGGHGGGGGSGPIAGGGGHSGAGAAIKHGAFSASRGIEHGGVHVAHAIDAFGRAAIDIALTAPEWNDDPSLPHDGGQPQMYLEMTLVDNHTGLALWHAHQLFPASAESTGDITRVARTMLQALPNRTLVLHTASN